MKSHQSEGASERGREREGERERGRERGRVERRREGEGESKHVKTNEVQKQRQPAFKARDRQEVCLSNRFWARTAAGLAAPMDRRGVTQSIGVAKDLIMAPLCRS